MNRAILTRDRLEPRLVVARGFILAAVLLGGLGGCVQVSAPDKPIEINLNINIRQEVVVRLQEDVRDLIKKNPGVF
jgi:hypothetical protein